MSKTVRIPLALWIISILFVSTSLYAAQKPGPHGGKVFKSGKIAVEFTVDKDEHAHLFRLNEKNIPVAMGSMRISLKALTPKKALSISLSRTVEGMGKESDEIEHLAGSKPMPGPEEYPAEISVKLGTKSKVFRFQFIEGFCAECGKPAFACICP